MKDVFQEIAEKPVSIYIRVQKNDEWKRETKERTRTPGIESKSHKIHNIYSVLFFQK